MSKALQTMARLAKVKQDVAMAKAKRLASQVAKAKDLQDQVIGFAGEYGTMAMEQGLSGTSVAMMQDALAFRTRLLDGASEQALASAELNRQLKQANALAMAARMKSKGLDDAVARRKQVALREQEESEAQEIEESISARLTLAANRKARVGIEDA
jgi:flagellar biosynthesis chaperone FliJ